MPQEFIAPVLRNVDIDRGTWLLEFETPSAVSNVQPAQFFMIGIPSSDVLLRRPYSVCGLPGTFDHARPGTIQILYRVFGRGTRLLSSIGPGATLRVLGPLGRGFVAPDRVDAKIVLVAGGIGCAPFPGFISELKRAGRRATMIYGARSASELPLLDWFRERCEAVEVTTDDGSLGIGGLVTGPLQALLDGPDRERLHVYACGPTPMLKAVTRHVTAAGVTCDLALEAPMACGFGVCLGCVVPTRDTTHGSIDYKRVCVEGPVMPAGDLAW